MKAHALLAIAAGLLLAAGAHPEKDRTTKTDQFEGEWQLVSTQDEKHIDPGCEESRMIVGSGGVVFQLAGRTLNRGTFAFGTTGSLDLVLADGKTLLGVYEHKDDDLVLCFAEAGQDRPAGTAPKGTQWAERWRKVKP
jgi:uncharacterized protein (TIGR03067 family)